jgi:two-component system, sensor histidine kinase PdtaS
MVNIPYITRCGLPGIEHVPFGMHACHFYRNRNELVAAMVPYFIAGLRENERCLWITAPPLPAHEASQALRDRVGWRRRGHPGGCASHPRLRPVVREFGAVEGTRLIQFWLEEEERALAEGYNGLRITGNTSFLTPGGTRTTARSSVRTPTGR